MGGFGNRPTLAPCREGEKGPAIGVDASLWGREFMDLEVVDASGCRLGLDVVDGGRSGLWGLIVMTYQITLY